MKSDQRKQPDKPTTLETRLVIPPQVISRPVGEETVLLDLASGQYFGLDSVGVRIWASIADGRSLAETADLIVAEFEVGEEQARSDVMEFATSLVERGLLAHRLLDE